MTNLSVDETTTKAVDYNSQVEEVLALTNDYIHFGWTEQSSKPYVSNFESFDRGVWSVGTIKEHTKNGDLKFSLIPRVGIYCEYSELKQNKYATVMEHLDRVRKSRNILTEKLNKNWGAGQLEAERIMSMCLEYQVKLDDIEGVSPVFYNLMRKNTLNLETKYIIAVSKMSNDVEEAQFLVTSLGTDFLDTLVTVM
jgi:hypothetical protein